MYAQTYSLELHDLESICLMVEQETRYGFHFFLDLLLFLLNSLNVFNALLYHALSSTLSIHVYTTYLIICMYPLLCAKTCVVCQEAFVCSIMNIYDISLLLHVITIILSEPP